MLAQLSKKGSAVTKDIENAAIATKRYLSMSFMILII
jgi:hypothetical protein